MTQADYVHLRVHSAYSLSEGALRIPEIVSLCQQQAMPAVAVTDTGNMFGALEFSVACRRGGVQPIIGTLLYIVEPTDNGRQPEAYPVVLLAQNEVGYANLLKLSSMAFLETVELDRPSVAVADLRDHADGVLALTGGADGLFGHMIESGRAAAAEKLFIEFLDIYPGRLYVELQRHGMPTETRTEPVFLDWAYRFDVPLVATNDVFFTDPDMYEAHDALICIAAGAYVDQSDRRRLTPDHHFKPAVEMRELFADLPEAVDNTLVVARRCAVASPERAPIMPRYNSSEDRDEAAELVDLAKNGLQDRLDAHVLNATMSAQEQETSAQPYRERLDYELQVIIDMGFAGYFLIVADFIRFARDQGIPVGPGRGSGAGSVAAWSLGITDLDPLPFGLVFERFLNPDRVTMPDFDIDFCQDRRDEVIDYVQRKYGADRVAQIITFGKLQARAVLRDVGRVLQMPYSQVDRLCKMVPNNPANPVTLAQAIERETRLQEARDNDPRVAKLLEISRRLEGLYRHASTHAAGVVIGDRPLVQLIPLYRDPRSEMPVTQFSMKYAEASGLIKFDFLGLKTLTVLEHARQLVAARGIEIDLAKLPLDDKDAYEMLASGETVGVFQFEGSGMRDLLRDAQPSHIEDLIALVALFRPGPMENIPKYIACKHGREQPEVLHELIEPVVQDTYGVIIYQEQVIRIAQVFAGFTLGEADLLRYAMGKKVKSEMAAQRERFIDGAVKNGVGRDRAAYVFDLVDKFAGYGFNKAHSTGYALVAYHTAWMKVHYPLEFFAATMSLDQSNTDKLNVYRRELQRLKIDLRPPDINRSFVDFAVETDADGIGAIRYALAAVRNVGRAAMDALVTEREASGKYESITDLATRLDAHILNKRQLENLACAGTFDSLGEERARVFSGAEALVRLATSAANDRDSQQQSLFGETGAESSGFSLPVAAAWQPTERLGREFAALGLYMSAHPLDTYQRETKRLGVMEISDVETRVNEESRRYNVAGIVHSIQERRSARGNRFARIQLSDTSKSYEITAFSEVLAQAGELLEEGNLLVLTIEAATDGDFQRFTAQSIHSLEKMAADTDAGLSISICEPDAITKVKKILYESGRGKGPINLVLKLDDCQTEVDVMLNQRFAISPIVRERVQGVPGVREVIDL